MLTEMLLQFLWKFRLFAHPVVRTSDGETVEIIHPGYQNFDAGPDFFNAKVKIGDTMWAGNVEIHHKTSQWNDHRHHLDKAYNNVILHVVMEHDDCVSTESGRIVPVLVMPVMPELEMRYREMMDHSQWLSCCGSRFALPEAESSVWLESLLIGRLEDRCLKMQQLLTYFHGDWDQVCFVMLARAFGFGVNSDAFESLALLTPVRRLMQHADQIEQLEAMLMGQAGFLDERVGDDYQDRLSSEYLFFKEKYSLKTMGSHRWKFLRLRPKNFPTVRLAQLAQWVHHHPQVTGAILGAKSVDDLRARFRLVASEPWLTRYRFGDCDVPLEKTLGVSSQNLLLINGIIPFLFAYARHRGDSHGMDLAIDMMAQLPPERNHIVHDWEARGGIVACNAAQSQALIYQYNHYCLPRKCLQCRVGMGYLQSACSLQS
ncbi:MAG: DUF2851 family protein [Marinilabiliaceae bacterium]|nr:DUF2851 family protein [Marinilabiliaceae bacterium]